MNKFIGRKREIKLLKQHVKPNLARLIVVKGRRRIGKSRLLLEFGQEFDQVFSFSGLPPSQVAEAYSQKEEFAKQLMRQSKAVLTRFDDWGDLFWALSEQVTQKKTLIILDEVTWMGQDDPLFLSKLKVAWDLYLSQIPGVVVALCSSLSAWIDKNILSSTAFLGRISLDLTLEELSLQECKQFWCKQQVVDEEILKVLAITGGVPRYLEEINDNEPAETNIHRICFSSSGILFSEFEKIFSDLFHERHALYQRIMDCLALGKRTLSEIIEQLQLDKNGRISLYLEDLIKSGFISKDFTWDIASKKIKRISEYRLRDNYSRFYLKYIKPNHLAILNGNYQDKPLTTLPGWAAMLGLQFENLVLSNRALIKKALDINPAEIVCDNPYLQRKTKRQEACQIDYLIQTVHNTLYLCEIKFSKKEIGMKAVIEVKEKIKRLKIPRNFSIRPVLIHVNGVQETVEDLQFFAHMISMSELI